MKVNDNPLKTYHVKRSPEEVMAYAESCRAQRLASPTEAEQGFNEILRECGFIEGKDCERERIITYAAGREFIIVDFVIKSGSQELIVEIDGPTHASQSGYDRQRDLFLAGLGFKTVRFTNREILKQSEAVRARISEAMNAQ